MTTQKTTPSCTSCFERLRKRPGLLRQGPRQLSLLGSVGARGGAVDRAFGDALQDRGDAEQAVDEIKLPARDRLAPRTPAIGRDIVRLAGNPERREIDAREAAEQFRRHPPG